MPANTKADAIEWWNTRTTLQPQPVRVDEPLPLLFCDSHSLKQRLETARDFFSANATRQHFAIHRADQLSSDLAAALSQPQWMEWRDSFQSRVQPWMMECFGPEISADGIERNHRFLEESLELVQSLGCTVFEAHQIVDYVYGRPVGEPSQEVGGVMVTLAALCLAHKLDMHEAGETELRRISEPETVLRIRAKQAAKPKHSPLPSPPTETKA